MRSGAGALRPSCRSNVGRRGFFVVRDSGTSLDEFQCLGKPYFPSETRGLEHKKDDTVPIGICVLYFYREKKSRGYTGRDEISKICIVEEIGSVIERHSTMFIIGENVHPSDSYSSTSVIPRFGPKFVSTRPGPWTSKSIWGRSKRRKDVRSHTRHPPTTTTVHTLCVRFSTPTDPPSPTLNFTQDFPVNLP